MLTLYLPIPASIWTSDQVTMPANLHTMYCLDGVLEKAWCLNYPVQPIIPITHSLVYTKYTWCGCYPISIVWLSIFLSTWKHGEELVKISVTTKMATESKWATQVGDISHSVGKCQHKLNQRWLNWAYCMKGINTMSLEAPGSHPSTIPGDQWTLWADGDLQLPISQHGHPIPRQHSCSSCCEWIRFRVNWWYWKLLEYKVVSGCHKEEWRAAEGSESMVSGLISRLIIHLPLCSVIVDKTMKNAMQENIRHLFCSLVV